MQVNQFGMVQLIHDVDFFAYQLLLHHVRHRDKLGGEDVASGALATTVHHTERPGTDLLQDVIFVVNGRMLDLNRLRHVLTVHIEHELIIVVRLLVAAPAYLLAGLIHVVHLLLDLSFNDTLSRDQRCHLARIRPAVYIFGAHTKVVLVPGAQSSHRQRAESCMTGADPGAHRVLALLHHVVGDVATAVPDRRLPADRQRVVADVVHLRESGRVWAIADLDLNNRGVLAEVVLCGDAIRTGVDAAAVTDGQHSMPLLHLNGVVAARLDYFTFPYPRDLRFGVASEWDLDDNVHTLVEEGGVAEPRRHIQLRRRLDEKLTFGGLDAALVGGTAEIFVGVFAEYVVDD